MNESTLVPREEVSDLDWLARNVHVWPEGKLEVLVRRPRNVDTLIWSSVLSDTGWITKAQWLARRAELQKKPSWAGHPDAKCFVQHRSGQWWKNVETCDVSPGFEGFWKANNIGNALWAYICKGEVLGDWRDTLEKRPEQSEFEPSVSVEDAKFSMLQSDDSAKDSGGLIDRFILVKEDAATAKQPAPKGIGSPILGMVLADLTNRALEGKEKYGEPLLAHNGRNALWDLYQELLDAAMYIRQAIEEQE